MPLIFEKNGKLIFTLEDNKTGNDPITGEPIFETKEEIVDVHIEKNDNKIYQNLIEGKNPDSFYIVGRCINPKYLNLKQRKQKIAKCKILINRDLDIWKKYKLQLRMSPKSNNYFENFLGEYIEGEIISEIE